MGYPNEWSEKKREIVDIVRECVEQYHGSWSRIYSEPRKGRQFIDGRSLKFYRVSCSSRKELDKCLKRRLKPFSVEFKWIRATYTLSLVITRRVD